MLKQKHRKATFAQYLALVFNLALSRKISAVVALISDTARCFRRYAQIAEFLELDIDVCAVEMKELAIEVVGEIGWIWMCEGFEDFAALREVELATL